jgi:hypothetical protein
MRLCMFSSKNADMWLPWWPSYRPKNNESLPGLSWLSVITACAVGREGRGDATCEEAGAEVCGGWSAVATMWEIKQLKKRYRV